MPESSDERYIYERSFGIPIERARFDGEIK
jgi:hypothetical protein